MILFLSLSRILNCYRDVHFVLLIKINVLLEIYHTTGRRKST